MEKILKLVDLSKFNLFSSCNVDQLKQVSSRSVIKNYAKGDLIFMEGDQTNNVFLITSGIVIVFKTAYDGRRQIISSFSHGEILNLAPILLDEDPIFHANIGAFSQVELISISKNDFKHLLSENQSLALFLLQVQAKRLQKLTNLSTDMALLPVRSRLAKFLLTQADSKSDCYKLTQDEIAEFIGSVRDVVGRNLREFEELGFLKKDRNRIILLDRKGLESISSDR